MSSLVVVESPSKTNKLASFLGKDFEVTSSVGHIRDLPKSGLGVDVENNYEPEYVLSPDKQDVIKDLKKLAKKADAIYLATDLDREGEAIAWHVANIVNGGKDVVKNPDDENSMLAEKLKSKEGGSVKVYRVTFNSITKNAVLEAFEHPRSLDYHLVDAQQGRRVLDRLVGYKLSPLLWEKIRYGLSAGRVQSVAVRLIVERENEINDFSKHPYYEINCELEAKKEKFLAKLVKIDGENIYKKEKFELFAGDYSASKTTIDTKDKAEAIEKDLEKSKLKIDDLAEKETKTHPSPPFTTSTLQQAASSNLGFAPRRTMQLAQKLYEGGYITYMRTDSVAINSDAVKDIRSHIKKEHGDDYLISKERYFKGKKEQKTQEAHEAIRPTDVTLAEDALPKGVTPQQKKLYDLIYRRTLATQMTPAVFTSTKVKFASGKYELESRGSVLKFDGFLKVYRKKSNDMILPELSIGDELPVKNVVLDDKEMSPPPRYNESSLVKELEKFNIGRPSTYAAIIATIQSRGYVKKLEKQLAPTDNGIVVNGLLVEHFPTIVDVDFTADMEEGLDKVALGEADWRKMIDDFYGDFEKTIEIKKKEIKKEDLVVLEKTDEECPECKKGHLIVKLGKYGKFLSCDQYPDCKFAKPMESDDEEGEVSEEDIPELKEKCPECAGKLILKEGRFGKFVACENYPKCKHTVAVLKKIEMKCPNCGDKHDGEVVIKKTRKGRTFYGCSRYPDCDYASWKNPKAEAEKNEESKE